MSESLTFSIQKMEYEGLDREIKRTSAAGLHAEADGGKKDLGGCI